MRGRSKFLFWLITLFFLTGVYYGLKGHGVFYWGYTGCNPCNIFVHWLGEDFHFKICEWTGCTYPFGLPGWTLPDFDF